MNGRKLGVLGGTFNPIHKGHLHMARQASRLFGLSEVYFVVAAIPPHKPRTGLTPLLHRFAMVCLATAGEPSFVPSLIEIEPPESPFTIDTLRKISRFYGTPGNRLYFVAGGDSLRDVATWRNSSRLLTQANFVFFARPGVSAPDPRDFLPGRSRAQLVNLRGCSPRNLRGFIEAADDARDCRIFLIDAGALDISSSCIRERAAAGKSLDDLVPRPVRLYIHKLKLYGA